MQFQETEYKLVEKILLGNGKFNKLQREFIELNETKTIVAGPGTGKTTALAAKIVLVLRHLNRIGSKDGLCIITHTNVAVNEINNALQQAGIGSIAHPHFIGTIHEFFNHFCVLPLYKYIFKINKLTFDVEHESDKEFYKAFLAQRYQWMNKPQYSNVKEWIANRIHDSKLVVNKETEGIEMVNSTSWEKFDNYSATMWQAKLSRKKQGFLTYDDTFLFSRFFLLDSRFKSMLQSRFKYVFLDEYQDTTPDGADLLEEIFGIENIIFQKIGDPYQTIVYGQPIPKIDEEQTFRLNLTNRFGVEIAEHLNIIMPQANVQTSSDKKSFTPIILLYENEQDIYTRYRTLIQEYELSHTSFKENTKEDKVLVWARHWASILKPGSVYKNKKPRKLESLNVLLKTLIVDFIAQKIVDNDGNISESKEWVTKHPKVNQLNKILLSILKSGINDEMKQALNDFVNELLEEKGLNRIDINNYLFSQLEDETQHTTFNLEESIGPVNDIFTIHSVKGETLRSVLVVDFIDKPLTNILLHKYGVNKEATYLYTDHNLLYVAMSRVTHLFVFAMHKRDWTTEVCNKLKNNWTVLEV
ncbi:AAA family ATPase (plasmid) [Priestia megaterium]|uniref:UvrD-helicase domain-containing protein n=1 Tax=Priestia megaterium TaxID=1404 RepID=UPI001EDAF1CD|nr:UvrD-helicase domain-containing protein [Priestia megaterium]UKJ83707.1 AAA family ATPase [Priestia megaterium]